MTTLTVLVFLSGAVIGGLAVFIGCRAYRRAVERKAEEARPRVFPGVLEIAKIMHSAVLVVGPHDEVLYSSMKARALGLARGSRVSLSPLLNEIRQHRRAGESGIVELRIQHRPGSEDVPLAARIAVVGGGSLLVIVEDLSAAERAAAARRDFVANISHELKTPIGAITVLSEAIEVAADSPDQVRHFAARMVTESNRLGELVGQIIDLSRLQADDPLGEETLVDMAEVAQAAVARQAERADARQITVVTDLAEGCAVVGDSTQLIDAASNLISNAIAYSDEHSRVAVICRRVQEEPDTFIDLSVADNGIGIPEEDKERIFERFYRVDDARSRQTGGSGLGLSIVRHIAFAHRGQVKVWSRLDHGSTFTLRLPAHVPVSGKNEEGGS